MGCYSFVRGTIKLPHLVNEFEANLCFFVYVAVFSSLVPVCLFVYLFFCLSLSLSTFVFCLPACLFSFVLFVVHLSICLFLRLLRFFSQSIHISVCLSVSIFLSVYLRFPLMRRRKKSLCLRLVFFLVCLFLSLSAFLLLSVCPGFCLSVFQSVYFYLFHHLFKSKISVSSSLSDSSSFYFFPLSQSPYQAIFLSIFVGLWFIRSTCPSMQLYIIYLSICLCLSIFVGSLSVYQSVYVTILARLGLALLIALSVCLFIY